MHSKQIRRALGAAATLTLAVTLAACGSGEEDQPGTGSGSSTSATTLPEGVNAADVSFARQMVPHHEQAVTMSQLASQRASTDEVKTLATQIEQAQGPEIETMTGWLASWGQPAPADDPMAGHDVSGSGGMAAMDGMMTEQEMTDLGRASGPAFDRQWLEMMIRHHKGAVTMAESEMQDGQDADAKALAQEMAAAQTTEIATMEQVLATLS